MKYIIRLFSQKKQPFFVSSASLRVIFLFTPLKIRLKELYCKVEFYI